MDRIIRRITLALLALFVVLVFAFQSGSSRPFNEVRSSVENAVDTSRLQDSGAAALKRYYNLDAADYDGVMLYTSVHPMSAEELLLIHAASDGQIAGLEEALQGRLADKKAEFGTYAPEQTALVENAVLLIRGRYVFLAVSADADRYRKAFTDGL